MTSVKTPQANVDLDAKAVDAKAGRRLAAGIVVGGLTIVVMQIGFVILASVVDADAPAPISPVAPVAAGEESGSPRG